MPDPKQRQQKSLRSDRRLRHVCRVLDADRFALCVRLDADNRFGVVLFLEDLVVCLLCRLVLGVDAFESDLYVRDRVDPGFESGDLSVVLLSLDVLLRDLLLDLADLRLDPLIVELEALFLQARPCGCSIASQG